MPFPDFLCIGAQKAGTTWLHHQLKEHPDIWLPPVKELHYFDRPQVKRYINYFFRRGLLGRTVRRNFMRLLLRRNPGWHWRFVFGKRTDKFYSSLFQPRENQICGEITPAYSRLRKEHVGRIASTVPTVKVIYLLRYPPDRIWSQVNMYKRVRKKDLHFPTQEVVTVKRDMLILNSQYYSNLSLWRAYFNPEQIFVGFFDELETNPENLLDSICRFLEVDPKKFPKTEKTHEPKNKGDYQEKMPKELEKHFTRELFHEIEMIYRTYPNDFTEAWMKRASKTLEIG